MRVQRRNQMMKKHGGSRLKEKISNCCINGFYACVSPIQTLHWLILLGKTLERQKKNGWWNMIPKTSNTSGRWKTIKKNTWKTMTRSKCHSKTYCRSCLATKTSHLTSSGNGWDISTSCAKAKRSVGTWRNNSSITINTFGTARTTPTNLSWSAGRTQRRCCWVLGSLKTSANNSSWT